MFEESEVPLPLPLALAGRFAMRVSILKGKAGSLSAEGMTGRSMDQLIRVGLRVDAGEEADSEELAKLAMQLRAQLLELDVERVDLVSVGPAQEGTHADEALMAGALIVSLIPSSGLPCSSGRL